MSCATYNTPTRSGLARLRSGLLIAGQAVLLILLAATAYAYIWIVAALMEPADAQMRCFQTAAQGTYCRDQLDWGDSQ